MCCRSKSHARQEALEPELDDNARTGRVVPVRNHGPDNWRVGDAGESRTRNTTGPLATQTSGALCRDCGHTFEYHDPVQARALFGSFGGGLAFDRLDCFYDDSVLKTGCECAGFEASGRERARRLWRLARRPDTMCAICMHLRRDHLVNGRSYAEWTGERGCAFSGASCGCPSFWASEFLSRFASRE